MRFKLLSESNKNVDINKIFTRNEIVSCNLIALKEKKNEKTFSVFNGEDNKDEEADA